MSAGLSGLLVTLSAIFVLLVPRGDGQKRSQSDSVFLSRDGVFRISYPSQWQICRAGEMGPCQISYFPVCDNDAAVCVVYPTDGLDGGGLRAGAFEVREIHRDREMMTADVCATPYPPKISGGFSEWPEFSISAKKPSETIGGILFVHGTSVYAGMSNWRSTDRYRAFHGGRCFELAVSKSGVALGVSDPPEKPFSSQQQKSLDAGLSRILHTFRFRQ